MSKSFYLLLIFITFTIVLFSSCQSNENFESDLQDTDWMAISFTIEMPTYRNSDTTFSVQANPSNWEEVLKGKPAKIHLKSDGSYNEEHFDVNDNRILNYQGTWSVEGDSLFFDIQKPASIRHAYLVRLNSNKSQMTLSRKLDFDRDKQADDEQTVIYKKQ